MNTQNFEVDLVYMWVDGSDPEWLKKKHQFTGTVNDNTESNTIARYINNDELRYSLRSAEKHAPWIRNIFIVTDNQKPNWLNTSHPKIKVVDHKEIMPIEILPCFNSSVIEYFLHKIPGLSEHFLFSNDDMFFNKDLNPEYFFGSDGFPIVRLKRKPLGKWHNRVKLMIGKQLGQYGDMLKRSAEMVEERFGKYYPGVPHHNIDSYLKSDYQNIMENIFGAEVKKSQFNRTRKYGELHRSVISFYVLATKHAHLKYVGRNESIRILAQRHNFENRLSKYNPDLFCLNDNQDTKEEQRRKIKPFLEKHFSTKSSFELSE